MMKKNIGPLCLLFIILFSCSDDTQTVQERGNLSFVFTKKDRNTEGRAKTDLQPAFLLLSISDNTGTPILTDKKVTLVSFGSEYVMEQVITLSSGPQKITKFAVLNASNEAIYATPVEGSDMASLVNDPLDINFIVAPNATTSLMIEVLPVTDTDNPADFGFATFSFEIVNLLPRLKDIFIDEYHSGSNLSHIAYQYAGNARTPETISFNPQCSSSIPGTCTEDGHETYTIDPATGRLLSVKTFYSGQLELTVTLKYNDNGSINNIESVWGVNQGSGVSREEFYYNNDGTINHSLWSRSLHAPIIGGYIREYTYSANKNVSKIETYYYSVGSGKGFRYVTEEHVYDNHPTNRYTNEDWWSGSRVKTHKNNIVASTYTEYSIIGNSDAMENVVVAIVEVKRTYEYNALGLPVKETVSNSTNAVYAETDGAIKTYVYE
jgi:hypothetical protein